MSQSGVALVSVRGSDHIGDRMRAALDSAVADGDPHDRERGGDVLRLPIVRYHGGDGASVDLIEQVRLDQRVLPPTARTVAEQHLAATRLDGAAEGDPEFQVGSISLPTVRQLATPLSPFISPGNFPDTNECKCTTTRVCTIINYISIKYTILSAHDMEKSRNDYFILRRWTRYCREKAFL